MLLYTVRLIKNGVRKTSARDLVVQRFLMPRLVVICTRIGSSSSFADDTVDPDAVCGSADRLGGLQDFEGALQLGNTVRARPLCIGSS